MMTAGSTLAVKLVVDEAGIPGSVRRSLNSLRQWD
jgi:hypothetical protein